MSFCEKVKDMNKDKSRVALFLCGAGVIPFYAAPIAILLFSQIEEGFVRHLLYTYAAIIVSFISGIHWGIYLVRDAPFDLFIRSNFVAIVAWLAVTFSSHLALLVLALCLTYLWLVDKKLFSQGLLDIWYFSLRSKITLLVVPSLAFSFVVFSV